jgi:thiamine-phosphate diphosphorylase
VVDRGAARGDLPSAVAAAVAGGVDEVQIRERQLEGRPLLALADAIAAAARSGAERAGRPVRVLVNRRADVALAIGADGLHLGFDAVDPATARRLLGAGARIGVSVHSAPEAAAVAAAAPGGPGADYLHLAPVFAPLSKESGRAPLGLGELSAAARCGVPVLAQGGIDAGNAREVCRAGAAGVAVTGALLGADDPGRAAAALRAALDARP